MYTDSIKHGAVNAPHRSLYHALGLTEEELASLGYTYDSKLTLDLTKILKICVLRCLMSS